jgi:hypothetical protein
VSDLVGVGRYTRDLGASIDRLYENALDWEHLPHLHKSDFASIAVIAHSHAGWQAEGVLADGSPVELDLVVTGNGWITRSAAAGRGASEIHTMAEAVTADRCRVHVTFFVADVPEAQRERVGAGFRQLYQRLYDEDERMMIARADALRRGPGALRLRRPATLADGSLCQVPVFCPHQGLPLDAEPDEDGLLTCPWHGYRFDVRTGQAVDGHRCSWAR